MSLLMIQSTISQTTHPTKISYKAYQHNKFNTLPKSQKNKLSRNFNKIINQSSLSGWINNGAIQCINKNQNSILSKSSLNSIKLMIS